MQSSFQNLEIVEEAEEYFNKYGERILFPEMDAIVYNRFGEEILHPCPEEVVQYDSENSIEEGVSNVG